MAHRCEATLMDGSGNHALACSGFPIHEDGRRCGRNGAGHLEDSMHPGIASDHGAIITGIVRLRSCQKLTSDQCAIDGFTQTRCGHRTNQIIRHFFSSRSPHPRRCRRKSTIGTTPLHRWDMACICSPYSAIPPNRTTAGTCPLDLRDRISLIGSSELPGTAW